VRRERQGRQDELRNDKSHTLSPLYIKPNLTQGKAALIYRSGAFAALKTEVVSLSWILKDFGTERAQIYV
jgi:hypothetical protein